MKSMESRDSLMVNFYKDFYNSNEFFNLGLFQRLI
jgi:hypothetical protein